MSMRAHSPNGTIHVPPLASSHYIHLTSPPSPLCSTQQEQNQADFEEKVRSGVGGAGGPSADAKIEAKFWNPKAGAFTTTSMVNNKMMKRKHQITSLAAQAQSMQLELAARRAAGMKTKRETMGKYGW